MAAMTVLHLHSAGHAVMLQSEQAGPTASLLPPPCFRLPAQDQICT